MISRMPYMLRKGSSGNRAWVATLGEAKSEFKRKEPQMDPDERRWKRKDFELVQKSDLQRGMCGFEPPIQTIQIVHPWFQNAKNPGVFSAV